MISSNSDSNSSVFSSSSSIRSSSKRWRIKIAFCLLFQVQYWFGCRLFLLDLARMHSEWLRLPFFVSHHQLGLERTKMEPPPEPKRANTFGQNCQQKRNSHNNWRVGNQVVEGNHHTFLPWLNEQRLPNISQITKLLIHFGFLLLSTWHHLEGKIRGCPSFRLLWDFKFKCCWWWSPNRKSGRNRFRIQKKSFPQVFRDTKTDSKQKKSIPFLILPPIIMVQ